MTEQSVFIDFMYAIAVGAALPRLDEGHFSLKDPVFWGMWFYIAIFLEDFYLYHTKIVPCLPSSFPTAKGFILTMLIVITWYISQVSFAGHRRMSLVAIAAFYSLRFLGGVLMPNSPFRTTSNPYFVIMIVASVYVALRLGKPFFSSPSRVLAVLIPTWVVTVTLWWIKALHLSCAATK